MSHCRFQCRYTSLTSNINVSIISAYYRQMKKIYHESQLIFDYQKYQEIKSEVRLMSDYITARKNHRNDVLLKILSYFNKFKKKKT